MNFTLDVKKEIITRSLSLKRTREEELAAKKAALSAFIRTSGQIGFTDGAPSFFIVSETETVAEFFTALFYDVFQLDLTVVSARKNRMSGKDKLLLRCPASEGKRVLQELGLLREKGDGFKQWIPWTIVQSDESRIAYIKGAFLGSGSCILPSKEGSTGYHLEFVFDEEAIAEEFQALLEDFELLAKCAARKDTFVVYVKSKEAISDFLSVIGATKALQKFTEIIERRDEANRSNRAANCFAGNADKAAQAAVKQVVAIRAFKETTGFEELSEELKRLAFARLENPTMSLQELAELTGVSKSCLNHRMRKLMELAKGTKEL
ncbi:MAG: DNA-binding protein WhiA [Clostridia bacterium]|nr:DNA-binding protein WhiA [Clostridia bacterium]